MVLFQQSIPLLNKYKYVYLGLALLNVFQLSAQEHLEKVKVIQTAEKINTELIDLYKHLHQNPELALQEKQTSLLMAERLRASGFKVTENLGGFGVVGVLRNGEGPTVLVRTDMDGLPVEEKTGVSFSSKIKMTDRSGKEVHVMHACGHDIHMSVFAGAAKSLSNLKELWKGTLIMVAQPAEEIGVGAKAMLDQGLYTKFPKPDFAVALHTNAFLPAGTVGFKEGPVMASVDRIDITVFGEGGHGASPHSTKDPIVLSAQLINAFQTIVSREANPIEPSVLTVGSIHGGNTHNIIPDQVKLQLTIRSYSDEVRSRMIESIKRISSNLARAAGVAEDKLPIVVVDTLWTPSTINDPELTKRLANSAKALLGNRNVVGVEPYMVGEDFSFFGRQKEKVQTTIFWLGAVSPEKYQQATKEKRSLPSLHSAYFVPDASPTILTGVQSMTFMVIDLFKK